MMCDVLMQGETMYFVIPSLHDYPRVPHNTKIDIREYVYTGHTVLMMGGVINIYLMNELFGFNLLPQYQPGPYLWNDRTAPGTPFEHVARKVYEQGNTRMGMTGVAIGSIPPGGQSYFDNNGASVALCVPLGRGRACYVDQVIPLLSLSIRSLLAPEVVLQTHLSVSEHSLSAGRLYLQPLP
jgi:hypothetical protein